MLSIEPFDCHWQRFEAICRHIHEQLVGMPSLRKVTSQKRGQFAMDLACIALSLRTGCLIDCISTPDPTHVFANLITGLRVACPEFGSIVHVYEPTSEQSFFVNISMLFDKRTPYNKTAYVHLGPDPSSFSLAAGPPPDLIFALDSLKEVLAAQTTLPCSITIKPGLPAESAIPLAAILLEYPVAYIPTTLDSPFLSNVTLDVYECVLSIGETVHTLLKFSCPSELGQQNSDMLGKSHLIKFLTDTYLPRIRAMTLIATFQVLHTNQNLDRIAL